MKSDCHQLLYWAKREPDATRFRRPRAIEPLELSTFFSLIHFLVIPSSSSSCTLYITTFDFQLYCIY